MESALNLNQRLQTVKSSFLPDNNIFFILDHSMKSVQGKKDFHLKHQFYSFCFNFPATLSTVFA